MRKRFSGTEYEEIKNMMEQIDAEVFEYCFAKYLDKNPRGFLEENYGKNGKIAKPQNWATCYNYSHGRTSMIAGMMSSVNFSPMYKIGVRGSHEQNSTQALRCAAC